MHVQHAHFWRIRVSNFWKIRGEDDDGNMCDGDAHDRSGGLVLHVAVVRGDAGMVSHLLHASCRTIAETRRFCTRVLNGTALGRPRRAHTIRLQISTVCHS